MDIHQISVTYQPEQDRILLRINTAGAEEMRLWLTRRLVLGLWPVLTRAVEQATTWAATAQGRGTPVSLAAQQMVGALERDAALQKSDFATPYRTAPDTRLPLGQVPLLVSEVRVAPQASGALRVAFQEKLEGGEPPRGFQLELTGTMVHGFVHLLDQAITQSQWRAPTPGESTTPDTGPGALESPLPRYLN